MPVKLILLSFALLDILSDTKILACQKEEVIWLSALLTSWSLSNSELGTTVKMLVVGALTGEFEKLYMDRNFLTIMSVDASSVV